MLRISIPYVLFGLLALAFAGGLLAFRPIHQEAPIPSLDFTIYGQLHLVLGYDSPEFMQDAHDPARLLEPRNIRQSRPGLILLAAGVERLLAPVREPILSWVRASGAEVRSDEYIPYVSYVLLNFLLLWLSFFVYWHIVGQGGGGRVVAAAFLGGLLAFNGVIKSFLWTPHTQLLNVLAPLFCLYVFQGITRLALFGRGRMLVLAFLAGLGVTAYGTFLLFIPSVLIAQTWVAVRDRVRVDWRMAGRLALVIFLTLLPFTAWVLYVRMTTGSFYQFEYSQGQFSWILPLLRSAPLRAVWLAAGNFGKMALEAGLQAAVLPVILAAVILVTADREHPLADRLKRMLKFPLEAWIVSGCFLLFFALSGLVIPRTAFTAVPPLAAGTAVVVNDLLDTAIPFRRKLGSGLVALLVLLQGLFVLFRVGPFH